MIKRKEYKLYGNVVRFPEKATRVGVVISKDARDVGNAEDPTVLRPGLILAIKAADGKAYVYGQKFSQGSRTATGDGTTKTFSLNQQHIVPFSEEVKVNNTKKERGLDYEINYKRGEVTFYTAPANGQSVVVTFLYATELDGTEIPFGVLENYVYLDEGDGPEDTTTYVVVSGHLIEEELKAPHGGLEWAKAYFAKHGCTGLTDPEAVL